MTDLTEMVVRSLLEEAELEHAARPAAAYHGEALVVALYRALKGIAFYGLDNHTFQHLTHEAYVIIRNVLDDAESLTLRVGRDACFCNNTLIRVTAGAYAACSGFMQWMRQHALGQLIIGAGVTEEELIALLDLLHRLEEGQADNSTRVMDALLARGIATLAVTPDIEPGDDGADASLKRQARGVYFSSIGVCKELMDTALHTPLNLRRAKRLMLSAVDLIMKDESTLLSLASIKRFDDYTYNHSVNVSIYAMALGNRLGLPPKYLNYLGLVGLFHDIGKMDVSREVLHKPAALTDDEWQEIRRHPHKGAEFILRLKGWGALPAMLIEGAFEHHLRYDLTGYPSVRRRQPAGLFSRIIAIADCYDALARPRVYRQTPYVTERILALFLQESGKQFDPLLVKVFTNLIGLYPIGSLVLLTTGEMGIVTRIPNDPALIAYPTVTLLKRDGLSYRKAGETDLSETDPTGAHPRRVAETLNPNDYQLNIEEYYF